MITEENFDFLAVVTGKAYPQDEVTLNFAEEIAYEVAKLEKLIASQTDATPEDVARREELEDKLNQLHKAMEPYKLTFIIRGVPHSTVLEPLRKQYKEKYPDEKKDVGGFPIEVPHKDFNYYYTLAENHAHIQAVRNHEGKTRTITIAEFEKLATDAPKSQYNKLIEAINKLSVEARFFEQQVDEDF